MTSPVNRYLRFINVVRRYMPNVTDPIQIQVMTDGNRVRLILATLKRLRDDQPLGHALGEFGDTRGEGGNGFWRAQLKSLYTNYVAQRNILANDFYTGLGTNLVQSMGIESFRTGQHGYLTGDSVFEAAGFYRRIGWETNHLHKTNNLLDRNPIRGEQGDRLMAEAESNRELDALLEQNQRWPRITVNGIQKTHPMRIREGLGLPRNWRPATEGSTSKDRIRHHAQQLRAHIQQGDHLTRVPPGSKLGVMQLIQRENIQTGAILD